MHGETVKYRKSLFSVGVTLYFPENYNADCNHAAWSTFFYKNYLNTNYLQQPKKQSSFGQAAIHQIFGH